MVYRRSRLTRSFIRAHHRSGSFASLFFARFSRCSLVHSSERIIVPARSHCSFLRVVVVARSFTIRTHHRSRSFALFFTSCSRSLIHPNGASSFAPARSHCCSLRVVLARSFIRTTHHHRCSSRSFTLFFACE